VRRVVAAAIAGLAIGAAGAWGVLALRPTSESEEVEERAPAPAERGGTASVRLDAEARSLAGIEVSPVAAREIPAETEVYGRILDPMPLAGLVFELDAARAADGAAQREAQRVKRLYRGAENASARELEAAEVARAQTRGALETARARLVTGWGEGLAARDDLTDLAGRLVTGRCAIARVDVPPGAEAPETPTARLVAFGSESPLESTALGVAPQTDPLLQGRGLLFLVERDPPPPGTAVTAWLRTSGAGIRGVDVPRAALLRHAGGVFAYVESAPNRFDRRPLTVVRPSEDGWLVAGGLAPGDRVVVSGAAILLSSELSSRLEED